MKPFAEIQNKRNLILLWVRGALLIAANTLASTTVLSGYLLYIGLTDGKIGSYLAITPIVSLIVSLLFSPMTAHFRISTPAYSVFALLTGVLTMTYVLLFRWTPENSGFFPALILLGCFLSTSTAIQNIFNYKQPCEIMEMKQYSLYISVDGIISGLVGIMTGVLLSVSFREFSFAAISRAAYLIAGILMVLAAFVNIFMKTCENAIINERTTVGTLDCMKKLFRNRDFLILAIPNVLRGFGVGVTSMILLLGVRALQLPESDGAIIVTCTNLANLIGCAIYGFLTARIRVNRVCLFGGALFCSLIPAFIGGRISFFVLFCLSYVGFMIVCNAVPDLIYQNVSPDIMSPFHTWRLALTTLGTTLSTSMIGAVIDRVPPTLILIVGTFAYFVCALSYSMIYRKKS